MQLGHRHDRCGESADCDIVIEDAADECCIYLTPGCACARPLAVIFMLVLK